jgi:flagellum-specific ATP synthase
MPAIADAKHMQEANAFRKLYSTYEQNKDLISVGAYVSGSDPVIDKAVERRPYFTKFLQQGLTEQVSMQSARANLSKVLMSPNLK